MKRSLKPSRPWGILLSAVLSGALGPVSATAANKNVWIYEPVNTRSSAQGMTVCLGDYVWFEAPQSGHPPGRSWSWYGATLVGSPTDSPSAADRTFTTAGGPFNVTATYDGETSYAALVKVVEVASATANATEIDDGDGNPNTRTFATCVGSGDVTVTATSNPSLTEEQLADVSCWATWGGTGDAKLTRTVSKATAGSTTVTFTAGTSSKSVTVLVRQQA